MRTMTKKDRMAAIGVATMLALGVGAFAFAAPKNPCSPQLARQAAQRIVRDFLDQVGDVEKSIGQDDRTDLRDAIQAELVVACGTGHF